MIFPHLQKAIQRNERAMYNKRPHSKYKTLCNSVVSLFHSEAGRHGFDMMPWTFHNRPEISRINSEFALIIIHDRVLQLSCSQTHFFFIIFQVSSMAAAAALCCRGSGQFSLCRKATKNNTIRWLMSFSVRASWYHIDTFYTGFLWLYFASAPLKKHIIRNMLLVTYNMS